MSKAWDKIFLLVSLSVLIGISIYLAISTSEQVAVIKASASSSATLGKAPEPLSAEVMAQKLEDWLQPRPWELSEEDHQLFVSRKYLYVPAEKAVKLYDKATLVDGLPLGWLEKNNLPFSDIHISSRDPDNDGFSNLSEFKAQTDPNDPSSHPSYVTVLRLKDRSEKKYRITFQLVSEVDGQLQFQISTPDSSKHLHYVKKDDEFDGFKVGDYREVKIDAKDAKPPRYETDFSELKLLNLKSQETATIIVNQEQNVPEVSATFVLLIPASMSSPVTAKVGEEFSTTVSLPNNQSVVNKFKLLKSSPTTTTILDESTANGTPLDIPPFNANEASDVIPVAK